MTVDRGSSADIELLMDHRKRLWEEVGSRSAEAIERVLPAYREWLIQGLSEGSILSFIARREGIVLGSGCLWIRHAHPKPSLSKFVEAYLMAMYTEPDYRRIKVASTIVQSAIDACRELGIERINLHASEAGMKVYEKMGFTYTTEMRLKLV